jgi:hypothetical protein
LLAAKTAAGKGCTVELGVLGCGAAAAGALGDSAVAAGALDGLLL